MCVAQFALQRTIFRSELLKTRCSPQRGALNPGYACRTTDRCNYWSWNGECHAKDHHCPHHHSCRSVARCIRSHNSANSLRCNEVTVASCFEAGRDGFWLDRFLVAHGVTNYVLEPTSILVSRRARRAKTDRLDAQGLLRVLTAYRRGEHHVCSVVRVPTPDEEDAKRQHREREHLVQERVRIENRIEALLATQGVGKRPSLRSWDRDLEGLRTGDGRRIRGPCLHPRTGSPPGHWRGAPAVD